MRSIAFSDLSPPIPAGLGGTSTHTRELVDTIITFHVSISLPPPPLLSTI